jgi:putative phosphoribosyl transferase
MYFGSRREAGEKLADKLQHYRYENTTVVALSDGAVAVAAPIAERLHSTISLLVSRPVTLPPSETLGVVTQDGSFTYDSSLPESEVSELSAEYNTVIEQAKMQKMHEINAIIGEVGITGPELLRGRVVIAVSDSLSDITPLEALEQFVKPIRIQRLVMAVPIATVPAVDKMHILADEIDCLSVTDNFVSADHYYNDEPPLDHNGAMKVLRRVITRWK